MHYGKLIRKINRRKYITYFLLNSSLIFLFQFIFFKLNLKNEIDLIFIPKFILITVTIIIIQYPFLKFYENWIYKISIYWLSMNLFFFLFGFFSEITLKSFKNGLIMIIYGNLIIIPYLWLVIIIAINYLLRKQIF